MTKAEIARQLGVSRAYITMITNGKRKPSQDIVNKVNSLSVNKQLQKYNPKSCSSTSSDTPPDSSRCNSLAYCSTLRPVRGLRGISSNTLYLDKGEEVPLPP
jgi:transcriptional regulator with XRE-family HTH domain